MWGVRGRREHPPLTHIQSNACRFLFLLFIYLRFAEAASFDKKSYAGAIHILTINIFNKTTISCEDSLHPGPEAHAGAFAMVFLSKDLITSLILGSRFSVLL